MEKSRKVEDLIKQLKKEGFTGFIRISYDLGGINGIEKNEEVLKARKA